MGIKTWVARKWAQRRNKQLKLEMKEAVALQEKTFHSLIRTARNTAFGKEHDFSSIRSTADFQARVPIGDYERQRHWFDRIRRGEVDVTWPGKPLYLAKTSGTTSGAKYIPITKVSIQDQIQGARDTLLAYIAETGKADFLNGKMMFLSGSPEIEHNEFGLKTGRLSGIVNHFVPTYLQTNRVPSYETNIIDDWEQKVKRIAAEVSTQDLRLISGIPPWVQMLFEEVEAQTGQKPLEVWPNLELFVHGGVNYEPYAPIFDDYFGEAISILELFPASEGFFALQNTQTDHSLMLLPNNGIFYEFIPLAEYGKPDARRLTLSQVEVGVQYALIISTNAGLWAYDIGDTVKFTSVDPWKLRVSGRVKHFISAFGEHVISEEVNAAILAATAETGTSFHEFTVAPLIVETRGASAHEWYIEFDQEPENLLDFAALIDEALRKQNPYYEDLRAGNILAPAKVYRLEKHASRAYMKSIGKLGGQNKFPRLSNDRKIVDALRPFVR